MSQSRGLYLSGGVPWLPHAAVLPHQWLLHRLLWRKRGLKALLWQRFWRILLPCLLGFLTVVPTTMWLSAKAIQSEGQRQVQRPPRADKPDQWSAVTQGNTDAVNRILAEGVDPNARHPQFGSTP